MTDLEHDELLKTHARVIELTARNIVELWVNDDGLGLEGGIFDSVEGYRIDLYEEVVSEVMRTTGWDREDGTKLIESGEPYNEQ